MNLFHLSERRQLKTLTHAVVLAGLLQSVNLAYAAPSMRLIDKAVKPRIIVSPGGTASEKFAARELATYLQKMSGQEIPIEENDALPAANSSKATASPLIVVGHHPANADLHPEKMALEESVVEVTPQRIRIVGGQLPPIALPKGGGFVRDRGTLYGVYEFLDSLGVRWYRPEPWGEHVPALPVLKVPIGRHTSKAAFQYRWSMSGYRYWTDETPQQSAWAKQWATRNRQNTMTWTGSEQGGFHALQIRHIYDTLFPADTYFAEHPEYFALIDGKRRKDGQLCLGNPEVQRLTAEKILQFAKENPEYESHSLEPNDNDLWCQCDLCKAMDDPNQKSILSGATLDWERPLGDIELCNRVSAFGKHVAETVYQSNKELKIIWLAYLTHTEPPTKVKQLPPNVRIMAAAFASAFTNPQDAYSDYSRDLYDPQSQPNRNFVRVLEGYGKMTPLMTYEYWSGIAWVGPMPLIDTMRDRLQAYHKLKMEGVYNEVHSHWGPQGIDLYFMTRLMWNPDLDVKKELDLYCKNYYGPAYKPMKEYHELLEKAAHSGIPFYSYGVGTHAIFTPAVVKRMGELITQAKAAIGKQEPYAKRFEGVWAGYEYTRLVLPYHELLAKGDKLEAAKAWERANKLILSYKEGDVFDNGVMFGSLQFFGNYNLNIPADIQKQARDLVAQETPVVAAN
jgi:hypothetical protein